MFASGLNLIYHKISSFKDEKTKNEAYNHLEDQLLKNPYIKHQFEVLSAIKKNKSKLTTEKEFKNFCKGLQKKRNQFLSENKQGSHLAFWRETKKLLEYFNINTKLIEVSKLDSVVDIYSSSKKLNENVLKSIVLRAPLPKVEPKKGTKMHTEGKKGPKQDLYDKEFRKTLKESFRRLKIQENELNLTKQFQIVRFLSECFKPQRKKMFEVSIRNLQEEKYRNYKSCVDKLYKLRLLGETILKEYRNEDNNDDEIGEFGGGKPASIQSKELQHITNAMMIVPINWKRPERVIITFDIVFYPIGNRSAAMSAGYHLKNKVNRLERGFINLTVYQKKRTNLFDPVGTIWTVKLKREQAIPHKPNLLHVECYISTNKERDGVNTFEDFEKGTSEMLADFDRALPHFVGDLKDLLDPKSLKSTEEGMVDTNLLKRQQGTKASLPDEDPEIFPGQGMFISHTKEDGEIDPEKEFKVRNADDMVDKDEETHRKALQAATGKGIRRAAKNSQGLVEK